MPALSTEGQAALDAYATALRTTTDASAVTVRNYLSDLRQFLAWAEAEWAAGHEEAVAFIPASLTTPVMPPKNCTAGNDSLRPARGSGG